jgi:hypothetical protein
MTLEAILSEIESLGGRVLLQNRAGLKTFLGPDKGWACTISHKDSTTNLRVCAMASGYGPSAEMALLEALGNFKRWKPQTSPQPQPKVILTLSDLDL